MHEETFEITRDTLGFHVFEMEDKLRTNFGETQANLVNLGIQRMDSEVNLRVLAAFQAAIPQGSPYYISAAGLSLPALNLALRQVRDTTMDDVVTIIGRATMTDQIIDALMGPGGPTSGFFPETNEALLRQGVLGVYRGARIITLKNFRDDTDTPFFPANELFVVGRDASKFAFFGGLMPARLPAMNSGESNNQASLSRPRVWTTPGGTARIERRTGTSFGRCSVPMGGAPACGLIERWPRKCWVAPFAATNTFTTRTASLGTIARRTWRCFRLRSTWLSTPVAQTPG